MELRKLDKSGIETSLLGFGCMRFPTTAEGKIDFAEAEKMLDKAYAAGVNYFDTAYPYHNGESELVVGEVMKKYDRSSFYLATKLPMWKVHSVADAEATFNEQLQKLQTDYVDFYLLHALNKEKWEEAKENGVVEYCAKLKEEGKIKNYGFSFHDDYEVFEEIIKAYPWDFCQIQYNYMDINYQAGDKGYALAESMNIPMVIMEPIKGGQLANIPSELTTKLKELQPEKSTASWALRWVASHPNVLTVLSGMSTYEQVEDNVNTFTNFEALSEEENKAIDELRVNIEKRIQVLCTGCEYCLPCPFDVNIPWNFRLLNNASMFDLKDKYKERYYAADIKKRASQCQKCQACVTKCPQHLDIPRLLEKVVREFEG